MIEMFNWKEKFRKRELEIIFKNCHDKYFDIVLELGAGAGLQTVPLFYYCKELLSSDFDPIRFDIKELSRLNDKIEYLICDAENITDTFKEKSMDLIFSSNLMEHLPNPEKAFKEIHSVLQDDGISISTMPSVFMKISYLIYFYPAKLTGYYKRFKTKITKKKKLNIVNKQYEIRKNYVHDNNPKYSRKKKTILSLLIPEPHGAYASNSKELFAWRKKRWEKLIEEQGFKVIRIIKLPVTTGYSFKLITFCKTLDKLGLCSSHAYIAVKNIDSSHKILFANP